MRSPARSRPGFTHLVRTTVCSLDGAVRIVSWNIRCRAAFAETEHAWRLLRDEFKADAALLQECVPAAGLDESDRLVYDEIGGTRSWGSAVVTHPDLTVERLVTNEAGDPCVVASRAAVVARIGDGVDALVLISIYGLLEQILRTQYSITSLHRILSDLTPLLEDPQRRGRIVLGGDLNASLEWDRRQGTPTHRLLFDRIEAFGLRPVLPYDGPQTYRHNQGSFPWQLDHVFVSEELHDSARAEVIDSPAVREVSDHNPIVLDLQI